MLQYLIYWDFRRFSTVEYLKRERKSKLTFFICYSLEHMRHHVSGLLCFLYLLPGITSPPLICMPQSSFRSLLKCHFLSEAISDPSIKNHNLSWFLHPKLCFIFSYTLCILFIHFSFLQGKESVLSTALINPWA